MVRNGEVDCTITVARCNLPTTTEANKEWKIGEEVVRGLDDIAHHYDYSFPESFLKAMDVVESVANTALALLTQYQIVIITSDHGLSRFAVTNAEKTKTPEGLVAEAPGRYASLVQDTYHVELNHQVVIDKGYICLLYTSALCPKAPNPLRRCWLRGDAGNVSLATATERRC